MLVTLIKTANSFDNNLGFSVLNPIIFGGHMIIINKNKPFYIDKKNKVIRMGNFTGTGKEIEYDDESLLSIFNNVQKPISKKSSS